MICSHITTSRKQFKDVIEHFHSEKMSDAHLGIHKVFNKILSRYHWLTMQTFIKKLCSFLQKILTV